MAGYSKEEKLRYQIKKQIPVGKELLFFVDQKIAKETSAGLQIRAKGMAEAFNKKGIYA